LRLRAIVTRGSSNDDIIKRADLLRTDSVHGNFPGTVIEDLENKALIINGHTVHMIDAKTLKMLIIRHMELMMLY